MVLSVKLRASIYGLNIGSSCCGLDTDVGLVAVVSFLLAFTMQTPENPIMVDRSKRSDAGNDTLLEVTAASQSTRSRHGIHIEQSE